MNELTLDSRIKLSKLEIRQDKKHYIVEDASSGEYYEMPEVCIDAIHLINDNLPLSEIEIRLRQKYPDEEVDLLGFVNQLLEFNLISELEGINVQKEITAKGLSGFLWIPVRVGKVFFNKFSYVIYFLLMGLNIALLIINPSLFPHYKDLFMFKYMVLNIPAWLFVLYCLVFFHEFGHILAMRANGFPTKLSFGHRLVIVVLETDVSSVWKLAPRKRYGVFFAGICFDMILLSIALIGQLISSNDSTLLISISHIIVLDIIIRISFQCCVYMKTDLYYVLETFSASYNLMESAQNAIFRRVPFVKRNLKEEVTFGHEKRIVSVYSMFYIIGVLLTISIFIFYFIPQIIYGWRNVWPGYTSSPTSLAFWDSMLFTVQIIIFSIILIRSWRKKYRRN